MNCHCCNVWISDDYFVNVYLFVLLANVSSFLNMKNTRCNICLHKYGCELLLYLSSQVPLTSNIESQAPSFVHESQLVL